MSAGHRESIMSPPSNVISFSELQQRLMALRSGDTHLVHLGLCMSQTFVSEGREPRARRLFEQQRSLVRLTHQGANSGSKKEHSYRDLGQILHLKLDCLRFSELSQIFG